MDTGSFSVEKNRSEVVEGGGDEGALAVAWGDGPGTDDVAGLAVELLVASSSEHEGELPSPLGVALDLGDQELASLPPLVGLNGVLQCGITHEHERGVLAGNVDRGGSQGLKPTSKNGHRSHIIGC